MLSDLKSIAVKATPIALDIYDKTDPTTLLPSMAVVISDPSLAEEVNLEWAAVFPELRKWVGDRVAQQGFAGRLKVRPELRSEERRVGKEGRSRCSRYHE